MKRQTVSFVLLCIHPRAQLCRACAHTLFALAFDERTHKAAQFDCLRFRAIIYVFVRTFRSRSAQYWTRTNYAASASTDARF